MCLDRLTFCHLLSSLPAAFMKKKEEKSIQRVVSRHCFTILPLFSHAASHMLYIQQSTLEEAFLDDVQWWTSVYFKWKYSDPLLKLKALIPQCENTSSKSPAFKALLRSKYVSIISNMYFGK